MQPFAQLSYKGQLRRLRGLAETALGEYGLAGARLTLLAHNQNAVYRADAASGERFVMRIHLPTGPSVEQINSEMLFLAAIRRDTDLAVPEPVPSCDGKMVITVAMAGEPESRNVVVFRWMDGRMLNRGLSAPAMQRVGEFEAALHNFAARFTPPPGFTRPRWDWERMFGPQSVFGTSRIEPFLDDEGRAMFAAASDALKTTMVEIGEGCDRFGIIHSDLQQSNYIFHEREVRAIDFEECGWGHYLFDMALTMSDLYDLRNLKDVAVLRAAFLDGYARMRPLPHRFEQHLPVFETMRMVDLVNWMVASDNPKLQARAPRMIAAAVDEIKRLLDPDG